MSGSIPKQFSSIRNGTTLIRFSPLHPDSFRWISCVRIKRPCETLHFRKLGRGAQLSLRPLHLELDSLPTLILSQVQVSCLGQKEQNFRQETKYKIKITDAKKATYVFIIGGRWHSGICLASRNGSRGFDSQPITPKEGSLGLPEGEILEVIMPFGG